MDPQFSSRVDKFLDQAVKLGLTPEDLKPVVLSFAKAINTSMHDQLDFLAWYEGDTNIKKILQEAANKKRQNA